MHVTVALKESAEDSIETAANALLRIKWWREDKKLCSKKITRRVIAMLKLKNQITALMGEGYK